MIKFRYGILLIALSAGTMSYGQPPPAYSRAKNTFRIMTYNIRNAKGMDNQTDYRRIADVIRTVLPDVAALQELDSVTRRNGETHVLQCLADLTAMYAVYSPAIDFDGGKYGIGILSREPPLSYKRIPLPGQEEARSLLVVEFEKYVCACTHFSLTRADRMASVAILNREAAACDKPFILAGDLNDTPESLVLETLKADWQLLGDPLQATFPSGQPDRKIDYILGYLSKGCTYAVRQHGVLNEPLASDHLPVFVDIGYGGAPLPSNSHGRLTPLPQ